MAMRLRHPWLLLPRVAFIGVRVPPLDNGHEMRGPLTQVPDQILPWSLGPAVPKKTDSCFESLQLVTQESA